jgi:hypothetical protein
MKTAKNILIVIGLAALVWVLWPALSGAAAAIMGGGQTVYHTQTGPALPPVQPAPMQPAPQTGPALPPAQPPAALPTAVYQTQAQPPPGLTDTQAAAVQGQLAAYQERIAQTAAALDYCQTAGRGLVNCGPLESQLKRLMAGQRNLLAAAAQAAGQ